jgi:tripartite-type tricarboxylate transporter receptor subunit TctC
MIQAGKLKAIAVTMAKRTPFLPDVPTSGEQGLAGLDVNSWVGLMAPAGTPRAIINRLNQEIVKVLARPDVRAAIEKNGAEPAAVGPADFARFLSAESTKWGAVVKKANVKVD